ncbi:flagellar basal body-associated FliL family protein [Alicyclobacillus tolerans]|uniref:flagellar basal body-associated FliL family protein n=1 Tax=Alicyclobacillus tolerans TaxID=90970 RepID=UPI001F003F3E|nr:flagellar basal body-associated FliL family protein [Alicyclobacillus tolerans]MCF8564762.1 flagellar basal body-associated FliL family protein [Alicyclobacillus tolerans]
MKKSVVIMASVLGSIAVLLAAGVGVDWYFKSAHTPKRPAPLTAAQAKALQVNLPQTVTNLKGSGLIQFAVTLQAANAATKNELTDLQADVQDSINQTMRQFTPDELRTTQGYETLKNAIKTNVNDILPQGSVSQVYLSQVVVQ